MNVRMRSLSGCSYSANRLADDGLTALDAVTAMAVFCASVGALANADTCRKINHAFVVAASDRYI